MKHSNRGQGSSSEASSAPATSGQKGASEGGRAERQRRRRRRGRNKSSAAANAPLEAKQAAPDSSANQQNAADKGKARDDVAKAGRADKTNKAKKGQKPNNRPQRDLFAAVDLGTNNCRLLIAQPWQKGQEPPNPRGRQRPGLVRSGQFRVTDAFSRIVRLGQGLSSSGRLSDEAMDRTIAALKICAKKMERARLSGKIAVATEACRRAENGEEFLKRVRQETGIELKIISGEDEAELALKSCVPLIDRQKTLSVVFDIGGGSTEVSVMPIDKLDQLVGPKMRGAQHRDFEIDSVSAPVGVVTFADRAQQAAKGGTGLSYGEMRNEVSSHFKQLAERHNLFELAQQGQLCVVGTGGTITTLRALDLDLKTYDRSQVDASHLSREDCERVIRDLQSMSPDQRAANGCIGQGRADLVLPGCAILEGMLDLWPVDQVSVADRGLREGLLVTMMDAHRRKNRRRRRRGGRQRGRDKSQATA